MNSNGGDNRSSERSVQISQVAQWRLARNLFAIYADLSRDSGLCPPPFSSFGADDRPESLEAVYQWFDTVDTNLPATNFRSAIGAASGMNGESSLYTVAQHLLSKRRTDVESRKKVEFVLVQYFLLCSPPSFHSKSVVCRDVAEVLQPLIGNSTDSTSEAALILENLAARLQNCATLRDLYDIFTALEKCKEEAEDSYYEQSVLARITHVQYLLRLVTRDIFRSSVEEIIRQTDELRERGVTTLDCRAAGLSDSEVLAALALKWKGLNQEDIENRIEELVPQLLGMEKTLTQTSASDPQMNAELASLRSLADRLSTQLAAVSQRVQRLEALIPASAWTSDSTRVRQTSHPEPFPPIAARAAAATPNLMPARTPADAIPQNGAPKNGNPHA